MISKISTVLKLPQKPQFQLLILLNQTVKKLVKIPNFATFFEGVFPLIVAYLPSFSQVSMVRGNYLADSAKK